MTSTQRPWLIGLVVTLLLAGVIWFCVRLAQSERAADQKPPERASGSSASVQFSPEESTQTIAVESADSVELSPEERNKQVDREHLRALHRGLLKYKQEHGHFPEYLSQLVPDYVDASALTSPRQKADGMNDNLADHPDPGVAKPGYGYEFSNLVFRDGRTFEDIKEVQRAEWGDAVPILRAFGYGKVINMSYGGDLYETQLNWEWDPATLDVVAMRGWGPGLSEGQFTTVRVVGPDGQPVSEAKVWADGRRYSFDLPNRPFTTDANGYVKIPLGTDVTSTALTLRVEGDGSASPMVTFPTGQPPQNFEASVEPAQIVGGKVLGADGLPVANTWIYLKPKPVVSDNGALLTTAPQLGVVKTDSEGRWSANLHPKDAAAFNVVVSSGSYPAKFSAGEPVDAAAALNGNAVTVLSSPARGADGGGK